ncbi:MAG: 50S ribosomal protein L28 [Myxococcota bacterium]
MSRECKLTQKKPKVGNKVSHANNRTKMRQLPNLQNKRVYCTELKRWIRIRLSAKALRTVTKLGLSKFLRKNGLTLKDIRA